MALGTTHTSFVPSATRRAGREGRGPQKRRWPWSDGSGLATRGTFFSEGAETGHEAIGHLSQTTSATGEGKYGSCMRAGAARWPHPFARSSKLLPDPLSWTEGRCRVRQSRLIMAGW
ncbi:hypothetical protein V8C26DRAFT_385130 [Trichoderma gracile]